MARGWGKGRARLKAVASLGARRGAGRRLEQLRTQLRQLRFQSAEVVGRGLHDAQRGVRARIKRKRPGVGCGLCSSASAAFPPRSPSCARGYPAAAQLRQRTRRREKTFAFCSPWCCEGESDAGWRIGAQRCGCRHVHLSRADRLPTLHATCGERGASGC